MALVFRQVCKHFDNSEMPTLNGINLEVENGEFVCIVGTSGCGKSTLLNLAAGLERDSAGWGKSDWSRGRADGHVPGTRVVSMAECD